MRAARVDDKDAIGSTVHPDAIFLLPLGVHAEGVVRRVANFENCWGLEERAGEEEFKKGDEPRTEKSSDAHPYQSAPRLIDFRGLRTNRRQTASGCSLGRTDGGRANILGCISATASSRLRHFRFWFGRI